jgi:acyl-CoA thioesterase FadM
MHSEWSDGYPTVQQIADATLYTLHKLGAGPYLDIKFLETDFKLPSRMGERLDLTLLLTRVGRSSLSVVIVGHVDGIERLRARLVTAMTSLETHQSVELPEALRAKFETYMKKTRQA